MKDKVKSELSTPLPVAVQRASNDIKWAGRVGFWVQLVLGVISTVTVLFASPTLLESNVTSSQGSGFGIFCAVCGLITLGIGIYFSVRYLGIAKKLKNTNPGLRPNKSDTIKVIRMGLLVNLIGMALTIIGAEAIVGIVLAKSLARPQLALGSDPKEFVNSIDLLIVQANTNTIAAHFAGIVSSLLLLNRITK